MGNKAISGNSLKARSSVDESVNARKSGNYERLIDEAEQSFSDSIGSMEGHDSRGLDGDEGEAPPPGSLNFHEYLTSEESKEVEKEPLMAQIEPARH